MASVPQTCACYPLRAPGLLQVWTPAGLGQLIQGKRKSFVEKGPCIRRRQPGQHQQKALLAFRLGLSPQELVGGDAGMWGQPAGPRGLRFRVLSSMK